MVRAWSLLVVLVLLGSAARAAPPSLDQRPAIEGEWGYHPAEDFASAVNPPSFSWRPQGGLRWELQCSPEVFFERDIYSVRGLSLNVHCPPMVFPRGTHHWRYRGRDRKGNVTAWSRVRRFVILPDAVEMPLPPRSELLDRIPKTHPRLFLRPENLSHLREQAGGARKAEFERLLESCRKILARPPDLAEPPKYPKGTIRGGDPWRKIWWGNRKRVIAALGGAAELAFARLLGGPEEYGLAAKRILLTCAEWDPRGSTGYRYNDEAGMPYAYHFSRTYTAVFDLLSEEQRTICRRVMKVRGEEMYRHLCPRHFWYPLNSHANRAWHFLGEVGIAFFGEIEGADDWVWFAANVFMNTYPVWSDEDGGWHEGANYWQSYVGRFTWWADVMREALGIDAFEKPYFARAGYYAMYLMPPGMRGGGFGDLTAKTTSSKLVPLMSSLARQARNPHWQWWVERCGGPKPAPGYVGFLRGAMPAVKPGAPTDLPTSRLFRGTGQAVLNSDLTDAAKSVQVVFKSSPFGTQSHGYEANNSFLLWAYGKRLLIRSGYRDSYGSAHHRNWMWSARSTNCITVDGKGLQPRHSAKARGKIVRFETAGSMDLVVGEAGGHRRAILFFKPDLVLVHDLVTADAPSEIAYHLHALNRFELPDRRRAVVLNGDVACEITFLHPRLSFAQTDQYDPNPRPRIKLREWHLTAAPGEKSDTVEFVVAYHPYRAGEDRPYRLAVEKEPGGRVVFAKRKGEMCAAFLPRGTGRGVRMRRERADGSVEEIGKE